MIEILERPETVLIISAWALIGGVGMFVWRPAVLLVLPLLLYVACWALVFGVYWPYLFLRRWNNLRSREVDGHE